MRRGFTLFEIILVMAILVILVAVSYPSIESMQDYYRLQGAADSVRGNWAEARTRAMEEGRPYRYSVVFGKGNFRVAPDSADYWAGDTPAPTDANNPPLVVSDSIPKPIRFARAGSPPGENDGDSALPPDSIGMNQWATLAVFLPDGTARDDVAVTLAAGSGTRPLVVRLRGLTGSTSVRPLEESR
jgi:prepilin-type N-terminal cleavage/methylation domain-containing protein